jgi:uncharacterized protein
MRILTISDTVEDTLYGPHVRINAGRVDMVLSAGDLPFYYLDYLASMLNVPAFFVYGNHGAEGAVSGDNSKHVAGFHNLDGRVVRAQGLLLAGLEGSIRYNKSSSFQYTQGQMLAKVLNLAPRLYLNRLRYGRYLDILLTHSPPFGIHDAPDLPHQGFHSFLRFMRWFRPRYLIHGHQHVYNRKTPTVTQYGETTVINTYGHRIIEWE